MERASRAQLVEALIRYELPIEPVLEGLARFPFDSAEELAEVRVDHVLAILERYLSGALTAEQVTDWAGYRIEMRDDVALKQPMPTSFATPSSCWLTPQSTKKLRASRRAGCSAS